MGPALFFLIERFPFFRGSICISSMAVWFDSLKIFPIGSFFVLYREFSKRAGFHCSTKIGNIMFSFNTSNSHHLPFKNKCNYCFCMSYNGTSNRIKSQCGFTLAISCLLRRTQGDISLLLHGVYISLSSVVMQSRCSHILLSFICRSKNNWCGQWVWLENDCLACCISSCRSKG